MGTEDEPAQGAGLALPEAIPELQAGAGATAAPACSHSSCLCLQEHRTRGEHGHGWLQRASGSLSSMAAFGDNSSSMADVDSGAVTHGKVRTSATLLSARKFCTETKILK